MKNRTFVICILVIIALFSGLILFSCNRGNKSGAAPSGEQVSAAMSRPFDAKATITMKDLVLTADINRTKPGQATIQIDEPKSLAGMSFSYDGDDITVSYMGFSVKLDGDSKLVSNVASLIVNTIDKASSPSGVDVSMADGALIVSGENDSGKFSIRLDKENGSIASISVPEVDFECRFDDFLFK